MKKLTMPSKSSINPMLTKLVTIWKQRTSALLEVEAKSSAEKNLPKPTGDKFIRYVGLFVKKTEECVNDITGLLPIVPSLIVVKKLRESRDVLVSSMRNRIREFQTTLSQLPVDPIPFDHKIITATAIIFLIGYLGLAAAEAWFSFRTFLYFIASREAATVICIVFAFVWLIGAETFVRFWNSGASIMRQVRRVLIFSFYTTIFYGVAYFRILERASSRAIINNERIPGFIDIDQFEVSILTAIGWLFFLGGIWLAENTPNLVEIRDAIRHKLQKLYIKKCHKKIDKLKALIQEENKKVSNEENRVITNWNSRAHAIKDVLGYIKSLFEQFKTTNFSYRSDGVYSDCFEQEVKVEIDTSLPNITQELVEIMQSINQTKS